MNDNEYVGSIKAIGGGSSDIKPDNGGGSGGIDFESDEPLVCKIDGSKPIEGCDACQ